MLIGEYNMENSRLMKFIFALFTACLVVSAAAFNIERILISSIFFVGALICAFIMVFSYKRVDVQKHTKK